MSYNFAALRPEIEKCWAEMQIADRRRKGLEKAAQRILESRDRYDTVAAATGVPAFVIACLHMRESSLDFATHLHNGDTLKRRTTHVPKGRPEAAPADGACYTWEESAIDALRFDRLDMVPEWSPARCAYEFELYNGFGPRMRGRASGYVWAGSDQYTRGKFVEDGSWNGSCVDQQPGCMPLLKVLAELAPDWVSFTKPAPVVPDLGPRTSAASVAVRSPSVWAAVTAFFATVWKGLVAVFVGAGELLHLLPDAKSEADAMTAPIQETAKLFGVPVDQVCTWVAAVAILVFLIRHIDRKALYLQVQAVLDQISGGAAAAPGASTKAA